MSNTQELYYLSGLLHDIGKFYQRADNSLDQSSLLDENSKGIADYICPLNEKWNYAYQHVIWSYDFIQKKITKFKKLGLTVNVFDKDQNTADHLINLVAYHHKPQSVHQSIIQLADWWASGIDRTTSKDYNKEALEKVKTGFKEKAILNIFSHIHVNGNIGKADSYLKADELHLGELTKGNENANSQQQYKKIWDAFNNEFDALPDDSIKNFNYSLTYLLKKYTWLIPASTIDFPDNSLFDHLKLTGAFSQIFHIAYTQHQDWFEFNNNRLSVKNGCYAASMGCADLSGIQNFIYNISSKYAARSLKGRSYYLQLLLETMQHEIMEKLGIQPGNFIYSSGGKMFFVFANTDENHTRLKQIQQDCERFLWDKYKGSLSLNLAAVNFTYNAKLSEIEIENHGNGDLGLLWKTVTESVSKLKARKFENIYVSEFENLFKPHDAGGIEDLCAVSGEELTANNKKQIKEDEGNDEEAIVISKIVEAQIELGKALKGGVISLLTNNKTFTPPVRKEHRFEDLLPFNYKVAIISHDELAEISSADHVICIKTLESDDNTFVGLLSGQDIRYGFRLYGGYDAPEKDDTTYKTFEDLVGEEGFTKLGFLRMDVDNLGQLFINGFDSIAKSFSAYATLSGMLDWFFSGHLNTIRDKADFKDDIQIIYAGGDDLFAVGRWNKMIDFADTVNTTFKSFTGREDISISGGISIVDAKFPVAKAADMAGEAEDKAKEHKYAETVKNAICIFGVPVNWDNEYPVVKSWKNDFCNWLDNGTITKGLLMKFFDYYEQHRHSANDISWKWNLIYQLARRMKSLRPDEVLKKQALEKIQQYWLTEIASNKTPMANFILACRWAELTNRNNN